MEHVHLIGERLKELRALKKVTQDDIATMLSVKRQTYSAYERGVSIPDAITLKKLADFFNVTTDYIVGLRDNDSPVPLEKQTLADDENEIDISNVQYAFLIKEGYEELTEEQKDDVRTVVRMMREKNKRKE